MNQVKIGKFIAHLRKKHNMTQRELAQELGVTDRAISKWENGRGLPDTSFLEPLSEFFKISINELLNGEYIESQSDKTTDKQLLNSLKKKHTVKRRVKIIFFILMIILVFIFLFNWLNALIACETLTVKFQNDFKSVYSECIEIEAVEQFKVINCDGHYAKVYYITENYKTGELLYFENANEEWVETKWVSLWSKEGSATEIIYPYWYHFVYFLF